MTDFTMAVDAEGVAVITWDVQGKSMNVMTLEAWDVLDGLIDQALGDATVRGIIITSGKDSFAGGMDLNVIAKMKEMAGDDPAKGLFDGIMNAHRIMRKIERAGMDPKPLKGGKPIAAALPGTALGIGLEIPLSCHRIFAADNPSAKIGLPEIMVGIFPGAGGTTRLVRKMGAMAASPLLLEGKLNDPKGAKAAGVIDEVVPATDLMARAKEWVLTAKDADIVKPWDAKGYKMPGGAPYHPAGFMTFVGASAMVNGKTKGVYPAAKALLSAVYEGALVPFDTALQIEARWLTNVLMNPSSGAMIRSLFINKEALEKGAVRPTDVPDQRVSKVGVLGAGMMGAGIALVSAQAGIEVVLLDRDQAAADRGKAHTAAFAQKGVARKKISEDKAKAMVDRITATTDFAALKGCDLIIEAVFEDPKIKAEVTSQVDAVTDADCIFATNTSTLPISDLSKAQPLILKFGHLDFNLLHKLSFVKDNKWFSSDFDFQLTASSLYLTSDPRATIPSQYHYPIIKLYRKHADYITFETEIIFTIKDIYQSFTLKPDFHYEPIDTLSQSWFSLISHDYYRRIFPRNIQDYIVLLARYNPDEYHLSNADPLAIYFFNFLYEE